MLFVGYNNVLLVTSESRAEVNIYDDLMTVANCTKQGMHLIIYYLKKVLLMT